MSQLRSTGLLRLGVVFALAGALSGCGSNKDTVEKRLADLRDEIVRVQNNQDRLAERLMAVELARMQEPKSPAKPTAASQNVERPPLKVIRLAPDAPAAPAVPADEVGEAKDDAPDGPRPVIRVRGKQGLLAPVDGRRELRQTETPPSKGT
jgi:hypothetical protein